MLSYRAKHKVFEFLDYLFFFFTLDADVCLFPLFDAAADVLLWRNKKISAGVLGGATAIWVLFELMEYHLLPLLCHTSILSIALIFLFSNAYTFIHK